MNEYKKIFVSSMSKNKNYKKILDFLSHKKFATKDEIAKALKIKAAGGTLTTVLSDLQQCHFIRSYAPVLNEKARNTIRYEIADEYINFYNKFILPNLQKIESHPEAFITNPLSFFDPLAFKINLGFMVEKECSKTIFD